LADRWHVIENEMLPETLEDLRDLRARLLERGYSRALVAGCLEFVLAKAESVHTPLNPGSASQYRKMLASVRAREREVGAARMGLVGTVAALGLVAALWGPPIMPATVNPQVGRGGNSSAARAGRIKTLLRKESCR
jgi:hypothetical protein